MEAAAVVASQPASRSWKAIVALVQALLALLFGWIGLWIFLTPLAVLFGVLALLDVRHGRAIRGRTMAWSAIAISVFAPVLWLLLYLVALSAGGGAYLG